jgi:hypothetical protein
MTIPTIAPVTALRMQAIRNGFIPVPLFGKSVPVFGTNNARKSLTGWTKLDRVTGAQIKLWERLWPDATNTGYLARSTPGLDIDILIEAAAEAVEMLAREHFEERGNIYVRIGLPPKRLIPLRTDEPFAKLYRTFKAPNGSEHKIEILGDGQQFVVDGIHPQSGKRYAWFGGDLATIHRVNLPYVRREDMEKFLDAATRLLVEEFKFIVTNASSNLQTNGGGAPRVHTNGGGKNPQADPELIADALDKIPNDADTDWERWYTIGMAVFRATGGSAEGFAAWDRWSQKNATKYDSNNTAQKWAAFSRSPPSKIGAGTIVHLARRVDPYWDRPWRRSKGNGQGG